MRTLTITVTGMHCASCGLLIDDSLLDVEGVTEATTDSKRGVCRVTADERASDAAILAAITEAGYSGTIA